MTWRHPIGLALLAAVPVILWLHRLRRRVPERTVPSLVPWLVLRVAEPMRRRRVPPTVLLALHVLCAVLLALAVAGPQRRGPAAASGDVALVMDTTLSMRAGNRWPAARAAAADVLAAAGGRVTIVELGRRPAVKVARTLDRDVAAAAIEALVPGGVGADVASALALAAAAAGDGARIEVVTDGALAAATDDPSVDASTRTDGGAPVRWHVVGQAAPPNVAVVGIAALDDAAGGVRVVARIASFDTAPATARITLAVDGRVVDETTMVVGRDAIVPSVWRIAARTGVAIVTAVRLDGRGAPSGDALPADDAASVPLQARERRVQLAGTSAALRRAIAAHPRLGVTEVGLGTLTDDGSMDVTVLHDASPTILPLGGAVIVAPRPGAWLDGATDGITGTWRSGAPHPITAGLDLDDARVSGVRAAAAPPWAEVLAEVGGRPAAWAGMLDGRRVVVLGFDPDGGTLAGREAFPVLVGRAIEWAAPDMPPASLTAGTPLRLPPWPVAITSPDGRRTLAALQFDGTYAPGLYTIRRRRTPRAGGADGGVVVAVRAGDAVESRLAARSEAELAAAFEPRHSATGASTGPRAARTQPPRPLQAWPLIAALLVLAVEAAWRAAPARRPPAAGRSPR